MRTIKSLEYRSKKNALLQIQLEINKIISEKVDNLETWASEEESKTGRQVEDYDGSEQSLL